MEQESSVNGATVMENRGGMRAVVRPILYLLRVFGVYTTNNNNNKRSTLCRYSFSIGMSILFWGDFARSCLVFCEVTTLGDLMGALILCMYALNLAFSYSTCLWSLSRNLPGFLTKFDNYEAEFGLSFDVVRANKRVRVMAITQCCFCLLVPFISSYFVIFSNPENDSFLRASSVPFDKMSEPLFILGTVFLSVCKFISGSSMIISTLFYCVICGYIKTEFNQVTRNVERLSDNKDDISKAIATCRSQHQFLIQILGSANVFIQHMYFVVYASGVPFICFALHGVIRAHLDVDGFVSMVGALVFCVLGMLFLTIVGSNLNLSIHEPLDKLFQIDVTSLPANTVHQISLFAMSINGRSRGIDVYGIFVVDGSTVLMLVGTVVTYAVVVLQL